MLNKTVQQAVVGAFQEAGLPTTGVTAIVSNQPDSDWQCAAMGVAKSVGRSGISVAADVAALLNENPLFEKASVSGPGFINLRLDDAILIAFATRSLLLPIIPQNIVLDFGGLNIAKSLHVGHLRSLVIGESLRRILLANGHAVRSDVHYGDWGLPMGMLVMEVMHRYPDFPTIIPVDFANTLMALYPEIAEACKEPSRRAEAQTVTKALQEGEYSAIWQAIRSLCLKAIEPEIKRLDAHFDVLLGESDTRTNLPILMHRLQDVGIMREDTGAQIIDVADTSDTKLLPPLIYRKSDGGYTYAATDLATLLTRIQMGADRIIYVADRRQNLHFEQLFRAATKILGPDAHIIMDHVGFGTVNGDDGKPFKTRDGGVPTLSSLLDAAVAKAFEYNSDTAEIVGVGAVKFGDLQDNRESGYVFDLDRIMAMDGKTGPYVQYACVRINRILAVVVDDPQGVYGPIKIIQPIERELLHICTLFPMTMQRAEERLMPHVIAEFVFSLAQCFSRFYGTCDVLTAEDAIKTSRIAICHLVKAILERCLYLLGISVPEAM